MLIKIDPREPSTSDLKDKEKRSKLRRALYGKLEDTGETLPATIKTMLKILAMDQERFASFVGIGISTLRKIEQSNGTVSLDILEKILDKFSLEIVVKIKKQKAQPPTSVS